MKQIAFDDMYCWSIFNEVRQIDFNGHLWIRDGGNVLIDPVPMSEEDLRQFDELGGARWIVITNCDHEREAVTKPMDLQHGGRLVFWFKYAKGHFPGCEVVFGTSGGSAGRAGPGPPSGKPEPP